MKTDLRQPKAIVPSQYFVAVLKKCTSERKMWYVSRRVFLSFFHRQIGQFLGGKSGIDHQEEDWGEPGNWSTREFESTQVKGQ